LLLRLRSQREACMASSSHRTPILESVILAEVEQRGLMRHKTIWIPYRRISKWSVDGWIVRDMSDHNVGQ